MADRVRDSRFEVLRIIAMFIIVLHHLIIHSAIDYQLTVSTNRIISQAYIIGGKVGVDIFLLISGYFAINSRFKISKALRIEGHVLTITLSALIFMLIYKPASVDQNGIMMSVFPVTNKGYWYMTSYMILFLVSPLINAVANNVTKNQYRFVLFILFFTQTIATTFLRNWNWTNDLTWFVFVYLIGGYIKKTETGKEKQKYVWLLLSVIFTLLIWGISIVRLYLAGDGKIDYSEINKLILSNSSFFALAIAFCLFMFFANIKPFYSKGVNLVSTQTLGIYLIQSNIYLSAIIWNKIEGLKLYENKLWGVWAILLAFAVFIICFVIELIRGVIFGKIKIINTLMNIVDTFFGCLFCK